VVVVVAHREEGGVDLARVGGQVEPRAVAVERDRAVEVGDPPVDVSHAERGVDRLALHADNLLGTGQPILAVLIYPRVEFEGTIPVRVLEPSTGSTGARATARSSPGRCRHPRDRFARRPLAARD
jgi:hypothetical protein